MVKTILITGGAGFIGSNFIHHWNKKYPADRLICLDALFVGSDPDNLSGLPHPAKLTFIHSDIRNKKLIAKLFKKYQFNFVVHFAAESHVDRSLQNPAPFFDINVIGTNVLLEATRDFKIKRFHYVSTDEIYGDIKSGTATENWPFRPTNPYSISKAAADMLTQSFGRAWGLPYSISRCSNNFGPRQHNEKFLPRMILLALQNKKLTIYGSGQQKRDWLYVLDHCRGIEKILLNKKAEGQIYNIGGGVSKTNLAVAKMILHHLGKPESLLTYVADRPGGDFRYSLSGQKIKIDLGFIPKTNFTRDLAQTIEWYKQNFLSNFPYSLIRAN